MAVTSQGRDASLDDGWRRPELRGPGYSYSLERGLAILECFTPARPVLGISEIADELGMSRATAYRYVRTLVSLGCLVQELSRKYRLALGVTGLGMSALSSTVLAEHAGPLLEELRRRYFFTVNLAVLDGPEIVYVARERGRRRGQQRIDLNLEVGSRLPVYCTAMGKLLLAYLPEGEQEELIAGLALSPAGPQTITTKKALRGELARIRGEGLAVNDEEFALGLYSIAAPVRSGSREVVAAINMAAHDSMISLQELVEHLGSHLIATADGISARLGYRRADEASHRGMRP